MNAPIPELRELRVDERLVLRPVGPADAEAFWALVERDRAHLGQWMSWVEKTTSLEIERTFLAGEAERQRRGEGVMFGIYEQASLRGAIDIHRIDAMNRCTSLGYYLACDATGSGRMTACVNAVTRYAFETVGLHRLEIIVAIDNRASRNVAERCGFRQEATLRERIRAGTRYLDAALYSKVQVTAAACDPRSAKRSLV